LIAENDTIDSCIEGDVVRYLRARWAAPVLIAVVMIPAGALPAVAVPARPSHDPGPDPVQSYVALGDAYAAGTLVPPQSGDPAGCQRSGRNYPSVLAERLRIPDFRDVSCSGGTTTEYFTSPQSVPGGANPAQFDALTEDTELVTVTIGGFDIGFDEILRECSTRSPQQPTGTACRDFYDRDGDDELAERIEDAAPDIEAALDEIDERSPDARVLLVGYPTLLPDTGPGCFPELPLSPGDVAYLRDIEKQLNAMLADEADAADVEYVDTYTPTIGHDLCQAPDIRWIEGFAPASPAAPVTPNAAGHAQIATVVAEAVNSADDD
jgi:hypothetical protein